LFCAFNLISPFIPHANVGSFFTYYPAMAESLDVWADGSGCALAFFLDVRGLAVVDAGA
jgi:hypothetical protein